MTIAELARVAYNKGYPYEWLATRIIVMLRDTDDVYGIGSMLSQWTGEDIAEDIKQRIAKELNDD